MAETFLFALNAFLPIVLLMVLGYFIKQVRIIDDHFIIILNKYVFRVGLPVLLFYNVYQIESFQAIKWEIVIYTSIMTIVIFILGILIVRLFVKKDDQKGVLLQSIFRSNYALIGIPLAQALGGAPALEIVSLLAAVAIPLGNILGVIALTMFQKDDQGDPISTKLLIKSVITNPLIIAVFVGLFALVIRSFIPKDNGVLVFSISGQLPFIMTSLRMISQTASPMALISLGGAFEISVVKPLLKQISLGVMLRTILVPSVTIIIAYLISHRYTELQDSYPALIALYGSPVAVSTAIMTQEMGGDVKLASQLVIWTTTASIFTIFFTIVILRSAGLL